MANNSVLILKELENGFNTGKALSGIVRLEFSSGLTEINLSLINLKPILNGEYYLYIFGEKSSVYTFLLPARPASFHKTVDGLRGLERGFASALVAVKEDIPLTVAFGKTQDFALDLYTAKKLIADKCFLERKLNLKKLERQQELSAPVEPQAQDQTQAYNDEAVATVNYFELEEELNDKLNKFKDLENEKLSDADVQTANYCQEKEEEKPSRADFLSNEEDLFASQGEREQQRPFYITAQKELGALFEKFPAYDNLKCYFPDSQWVKINYSADKYYVVGLIKENKKEKYICYGVPEKYSLEPPKELKGYCTFIPLSIFDMQGMGFWMMFQDAITGECIKPR